MWIRLIGAPWWVHWLMASLPAALFLSVLAIPEVPSATGWAWRAVSLIAVSLSIGSLVALIQRPARRTYAAQLDGLSRGQRRQVAEVLRRGDVPTDPAVLRAAVRVGTISMAYRRRLPSWQKSSPWPMVALCLAIAVLWFFTQSGLRAWAWSGMALVLAGLFVRNWYAGRGIERQAAVLRSAVSADPGATAELVDEADSIALPRRRPRLALVPALVMGASVAALMLFWNRPTPDCRTSDAVLTFIARHRDLLDARLITSGDPGLDDYQQWSNQLEYYSRDASAREIAPRLHRIADLSARAVGLVREVRQRPGVDPGSAEIVNRQGAYHDIVEQIIDEENALNRTCHPHR